MGKRRIFSFYARAWHLFRGGAVEAMQKTTEKPKIRKAVFPVAGMGTRFLPATKAMPKELLPIIDKPLIQYAVEEAVEAGITELVFVTGRTKRAIEDHFDHSPELETILEKSGKYELAKQIRDIVSKDVHCIFVRQPKALGLGHAILCAEPAVGNEPFAVLLPDDFMAGEIKPTSDLVQHFETTGRPSLSVMTVPDEAVGKYGVIAPDGDPSNHVVRFSSIVEKPAPDQAPSNLAAVGRYVFGPEIFDYLRSISPGVGNEYQLTDAINCQIAETPMDALTIQCQRYDCGSKLGYFKALVDHALERPEFKDVAREYLAEKLAESQGDDTHATD